MPASLTTFRERGFFCGHRLMPGHDMPLQQTWENDLPVAATGSNSREAVMLVLSRKRNQSVIIGDEVRVTVLKVVGNTVKLGIDAPPEISVMREELFRAIADRESARPLTCVELQLA